MQQTTERERTWEKERNGSGTTSGRRRGFGSRTERTEQRGEHQWRGGGRLEWRRVRRIFRRGLHGWGWFRCCCLPGTCEEEWGRPWDRYQDSIWSSPWMCCFDLLSFEKIFYCFPPLRLSMARCQAAKAGERAWRHLGHFHANSSPVTVDFVVIPTLTRGDRATSYGNWALAERALLRRKMKQATQNVTLTQNVTTFTAKCNINPKCNNFWRKM